MAASGGRRGAASLEEMATWVRGLLSAGRWQHTQRVAEMARRLALRWGADLQKVELAAILHDCARELATESLLKMAGDFGIVRDAISDAEPVLYHGPVAAAWAGSRWHIEDPEVLEAIAVHTTGRPGMGLVAKVLYLADALELGRNYPGVEALRQEALEDLDRALLGVLDNTIVYLVKGGRLIHPDSVAARNELVLRARDGRLPDAPAERPAGG